MKLGSILLCDFAPWAGSAEVLKTQLSAIASPPLTVHHERLSEMQGSAAMTFLGGVMAGLVPSLVVFILSPEAQSDASRFLGLVLQQIPTPPIVVVPCSEEPELISQLFHWGASDYLIPPFRTADVRPRLQRLLAYRESLATPASAIKQELGLSELVGESPALLEQIRKIPRVAACDASVLIRGETGTGKELCARAIHYLSARSAHPFVPLNCGAIPAELLENELFGHEAGAYTSATGAHAGLLHEADGGTLFLDEIDSLPLPAQVKLLRFLQEKTYRPLGAGKARKADVRILAASNVDLEPLMEQQRLRQDLFYRLNVLSLHLPPLRERRDDIPLLARHLLAKYAVEFKRPVRDFAPAALRKLPLYRWPGNVRELENVIERAVILCNGDTVQAHDLDLPAGLEPPLQEESFQCLKARAVAEFEQNYLCTVLERHQGNIGQAARSAQKNRRVFFELMRKHHIRVERVADSRDGKAVAKFVIVVDKKVHPSSRT